MCHVIHLYVRHDSNAFFFMVNFCVCINMSCDTCECDMSHIASSESPFWGPHIHTHTTTHALPQLVLTSIPYSHIHVNPMFTLWSIHTHWRVKYVTSHVPMGHVAHRNHVTHSLAWLTRLRHAHTYMHKHTCTTTDTYTDESHHTYSWVIESVRHDSFRVCDMTQQPFANRSSGAWVMWNIGTSHVTFGNESCHT